MKDLTLIVLVKNIRKYIYYFMVENNFFSQKQKVLTIKDITHRTNNIKIKNSFYQTSLKRQIGEIKK